MIAVHAAIRENQQREPGGNRLVRLAEQFFHRVFQIMLAAGVLKQNRNRRRPQMIMLQLADFRKRRIGQNRARQAQHAAMLRPFFQHVLLDAELALLRHDDFLADRVNRRVRHLREQLPEIGEQRLRLIRQHGQRRVRPHRAGRFQPFDGFWIEQKFHVFVCIAEGALPLGQRFRIAGGDAFRLRQFVQRDHIFPNPLTVGLLRRIFHFQFFIVNNPSGFRVNQEHFARLQAAFEGDFFFWNRQHAGFRSHDDGFVIDDAVPRRAQAVPIQHRSNITAIGKGDQHRAVPRLHHAGMIIVKIPFLLLHRGVALPRFRHHHHDRMRQIAPGQHEKFQRVVERRGIAAAGRDDRKHLRQLFAEQLALADMLAGGHAVDVAAQRVDFAVMAEHPVRVRQAPRRERVGAVTRMHERNRRPEGRIRQIGIKIF